AATRFLLINSVPWSQEVKKPPSERLCSNAQQCAQGIGYAVGVESARNANYPDDIVRNGAITNTALRVAEDMWNLDDFRIKQLAKYRIVNDMLSNPRGTGLHDIAHDYIQ